MQIGHQFIIDAMEKLHKTRLIILATLSVHADEDRKNFSTILPGIMAKILFPNAYRGMKKIEQLVKKSSLEWTVVRIINPNAKHKNNNHHFSLGDKPAKMSVSRENVGAFIYKTAVSNSFIRKMPIVFNE